MNLNNLKKIHLIGCGGSGVSAVARMMLKLGRQVSGSDLFRSDITDSLQALGADIVIGHDVNKLSPKTDLVIYSAAVPPDDQELSQAKKLDLEILSYAEFLGLLSTGKKTIAVCGTNGKTTTSAMCGKILAELGLDPTVIIGSELKNFQGNYRAGQSKYFVLEADEYKANMLKIKPWSILLTSIEEDHLDFYQNLSDIIRHFQLFVDQLPADGWMFYNADDRNIIKLKLPARALSCSLRRPADYWLKCFQKNPGCYRFTAMHLSENLGQFTVTIPGEYNVLNTLLVVALCHKLKLDLNKARRAVENFGGLRRRFEVLGPMKQAQDVLVASDYTHHPSAIAKTLQAAKDFYPNRRLFLVYQPHQHDRTKKLFEQFLTCFVKADLTILQEIYDVPGRQYAEDKTVSSKNLVEAINQPNMIYSPDAVASKKLILNHLKPQDLLLIMGAGDIDRLARELV